MTLQLKSCSRCGGDMQMNRDVYGEYKLCLHCGNMVDIPRASNPFLLEVGNEPTKKKAA